MILLQTDDASDPKDTDNDEVFNDVPTVMVPNNDSRASDDGNQNKNNASVCL